MSHKQPDKPDAALAALVNEARKTLRFMAECGCTGFDCSQETLTALETLGKQPPRPETLADIRADLGNCQRCRLCERRNHIVFGAGNPQARLVFVGEGPGYDEDRSGKPFVGKAGELLTKIIAAMKMTRDEVYICNVVKCRPPGNRNPEPDEIRACLPFLERQLSAIGPEFICALGGFAAKTLLRTDMPVSRLRGRFHDYGGSRVMPTFHPAFLLRNPEKKREVWEDMKKLMRAMGHSI